MMRESDVSIVRALDLFKNMEDQPFTLLMSGSFLQPFPAQVDLISEGDPADFLHLVIEGCVELFASSNGRSNTVAMMTSNTTFILAAVVCDGPYLMSARTCSPSKVLMVPAASVRAAIQEDVAFCHSVAQELAASYRDVIRSHKDIKLRTAVERLANRLLRYHREQGASGSLELPYDKRKLASILSMTPENLSRAFNTLKPYGVEVNGSVVCLTDVDGLSVLAKPNPLIDFE